MTRTTTQSSKAGAATSPQDTATQKPAAGYVVAEGHRFHSSKGELAAGDAVVAANFKTKADPTGKSELERQIAKGAVIAGKGKRKAGNPETESAGGGVVDGGGATGAAPSAAQINAAETDEGAAKVVDAALSGTEADLAAANGADAE